MADELDAAWESWARGESRCPYCVNLTCPVDWDVVCDCLMAPEPPPDHVCDVCRPSLDGES